MLCSPLTLTLFSLLHNLRNQNALCNRLLSLKQWYLIWNNYIREKIILIGAMQKVVNYVSRLRRLNENLFSSIHSVYFVLVIINH